MALNALRTEMVTFTGTPGFEANGVTIGYRPEYTPRTGTEAKYNSIAGLTTTILSDNGQYFIQLGEQLYNGDLRLNGDALDVYGRPARYWEYDGKEVGTYAKKELLRKDYNVAVTGVDMYNLLTNSVVNDDKYTLDVYVDGAEYTAPNNNDYVNFTKTNFTRNNKADMAYTGRGVQTEVYVDNNTKEITVAIINTYLAKAIADYSTTTEKVTVRVYDPYLGAANKELELKDFPEIEGMKKDDIILVNWADDTSITRNNEKSVTKVMDPETLIDSTITKFSTNGKVTKLTTNGTQYDSARMLDYDADVLYDYDENLLTDKTYDIYLDQFGNTIGVALHSGTDNYVFITGYDLSNSNYAVTRATANAIFLDGTMKVIDVDVKDTNTAIRVYNNKNTEQYDLWTAGNSGGDGYYTHINTWYTWTESNGVYTLRPVNADRQFATNPGTVTIDNKNIRQTGDNDKVTASVDNLVGWADDKSVFITVDVDEDQAIKGQANVIDEVNGCYTGIENVSITTDAALTAPAAYFLMDGKNYFIGAVVIGANNGANNNYAYIFGGAKSERFEAESSTRATNGTYYWEIDAVIDGQWKENVEIKTKYKAVIDVIKSKIDAGNAGDAAGEKWASGYLFRLSFDSNGYVTSAKPYDELASTTYIFANSQAPTGWTVNTDKQSVRYMNVGTVAYGNTGYDSQRLISRNERTLYNLSYTSDNGLRTADDCTFVVRQSEYGKNVTRVYSSLDAALAGITEADYITNGDTSIDFNGTVSAVLDGNARAKWIVFDNNTPLNADQNKPSTPVGNYTSWVEGNTVHVVLVDTNANLATIRSEAARALVAAGYSNPQTAMLSGAVSNAGVPTAVSGFAVCGNEWFAVDYINYWTVKVNGKIVEYVADGVAMDTTKGDIYDIEHSVGTGYLVVNGGNGYTYYNAHVQNGTAKAFNPGSGVKGAITITTGYVKVTDGTTPVTGGDWTVTGAVATRTAGEYGLKVGDTLTVTYTTSGAGSGDKDISIKAAGTGTVLDATGVTKTQSISSADFATSGKELVYTFATNGWDSDAALTDTSADTPAKHSLTLTPVAAPGAGDLIKVTNVTLDPVAGTDLYTAGQKVKVTITFTVGDLTGKSGADGTIVIKETNNTSSHANVTFVAGSNDQVIGDITLTDADAGSDNGGKITITKAKDYQDGVYTLTAVYTMPDYDSAVSVTVTQAT